MAVLVPTYQRSGRGDRGAQAEAGEDGKEQQNCEAFDGEGHGGRIGLVSVEVWIGMRVLMLVCGVGEGEEEEEGEGLRS
jgi:hypothetical protein